MQVHLNLATKPLETHRRFLAGAGLTAFVAALVFAGLGWYVYSVRKADEEIRTRTEKTVQEMKQLESKRKELEIYFGQKDIASLHDRAAFLNGVIDARSFNWTQMFMDLERILPGGVRVISIEPKQAGGHVEVKLTVGATSDDAKLKFLHALEESKQFKGYELQHEGPANQANNQSGDQKIIQLTTVYSRT
jgi:type IV pilus assembly protein PilN